MPVPHQFINRPNFQSISGPRYIRSQPPPPSPEMTAHWPHPLFTETSLPVWKGTFWIALIASYKNRPSHTCSILQTSSLWRAHVIHYEDCLSTKKNKFFEAQKWAIKKYEVNWRDLQLLIHGCPWRTAFFSQAVTIYLSSLTTTNNPEEVPCRSRKCLWSIPCSRNTLL